jgi:hypothetical protein
MCGLGAYVWSVAASAGALEARPAERAGSGQQWSQAREVNS